MIRSLGLALAAAFTLALPMAAMAAEPPAPDTKIDGGAHTQGQKEAPAAFQAAGVPCTVTDGYYVGDTTQKDSAGKPYKAKIYEGACKEGIGQILITGAAPNPAQHFDCITLADNPSIRCRLPGNTDAKAQIAPLVASAGQTCTVSAVRPVGATPKGDVFYEVACANALGFVLQHSPDGSNKASGCATLLGGNLECTLTTKAQIAAANRVAVDALIAKSGKACSVKDVRAMGKLTSGDEGYEVACQDGSGFILLAKDANTVDRTIACANATSIAGGCTLTDVSNAQTAEAGTYTRLAKNSGFPCQVQQYRYIGIDTRNNNEVVELKCSDRPDGGIATFPTDNSPGTVYDCVMAGALGQRCQLTDPSPSYAKYTAELRARGKTSCTVSNTHFIGHSSEANTDLIETACSDGLPGWVIELDAAHHIKELLTCGQIKASGVACTLPGNAK